MAKVVNEYVEFFKKEELQVGDIVLNTSCKKYYIVSRNQRGFLLTNLHNGNRYDHEANSLNELRESVKRDNDLRVIKDAEIVVRRISE